MFSRATASCCIVCLAFKANQYEPGVAYIAIHRVRYTSSAATGASLTAAAVPNDIKSTFLQNAFPKPAQMST